VIDIGGFLPIKYLFKENVELNQKINQKIMQQISKIISTSLFILKTSFGCNQ